MAWFKVDDGLWGSTKWIALAPTARALWVTGGSWSMHQLTDGKVPRHVLPTLGGRERDAAALVTAGLWETHPEGWIFHDWHEYQPSREKVLAERAAAKECQRKARDAAKSRRESQRDNGVTDAVTPPDVTPDVTGPPTRPDPTPLLSTSEGVRTETLRAVPATDPPKKKPTSSCTRHPYGNPADEPCNGCKADNQRKERKERREDDRIAREAERARLACRRCDGVWVTDDAGNSTGRKCDHRRAS